MTDHRKTPRTPRDGDRSHRDREDDATEPSHLERAVDWLEHRLLPPPERERSLRLQVIFFIVVLILAGLVARAQADMLRVGQPRQITGGVAVRVMARAPRGSVFAAGLYPRRCPRQPDVSDAHSGITAAAALLRIFPSDGETGPLQLCLWTWHGDGSVGSRAARRVVIAPERNASLGGAGSAAPGAWSPPGTTHPWYWVLLGWLTFGLGSSGVGLALALPWAIALGGAYVIARRFRRRHGAKHRRGSESEWPEVERLRGRANTDSAPGGDEQSTVEFPAVGATPGAAAEPQDAARPPRADPPPRDPGAGPSDGPSHGDGHSDEGLPPACDGAGDGGER